MASKTLKRLMKELEDWQDPDGSWFSTLAVEEKKHWTLAPVQSEAGPPEAPGLNYFKWEAVLRPAQGPFKEGQFCWQLVFPHDYPFIPPKYPLCWCGRLLPFASVAAGSEVLLSPSPDQPERRKGRVVERREDADELCVQWDEDGSVEEEAVSVVSREWWDGGAKPVPASTVVFHPFCKPSGDMCRCAVQRRWHPGNTVKSILAFLRASVEATTDPDEGLTPLLGLRPEAEFWCSCSMNLEAASLMKRDHDQWLVEARCRFLGGRPRPLCLQASKSAAPLTSSAASPSSEQAAAVDLVDIECTAGLSGDVLGRLRVTLDEPAAELLHKVMRAVPAPPDGSWWQVVLPAGTILDASLDTRTAAQLFGF